jgi:hypothetical protein
MCFSSRGSASASASTAASHNVSQHPHARTVIPNGGREFAARLGYATKLHQRLFRIGNEIEYQERDGGIKTRIGETQLLRIAYLKVVRSTRRFLLVA